jgi:putative ABC transport system permease protein
MNQLITFLKRYTLSSELIWLGLALWISIASLSSVTFLMDRLDQTFEKNAHELIAADLLVRGDQMLDPAFETKAKQEGLRTAKTIIFPTMARFQSQSKLVALKAVSDDYPLRGQLTLKFGSKGLSAQEIWIDEQLAKQMNLSIGQIIELGSSEFKITDIILKEMDRGAAFINFSPRVMIREADLTKTELLGLGSRATYRLLLASQDAIDFRSTQKQISQFQEWTKEYIVQKKLRGVKIEELENGQPVARKTIQQANKMMSLAALFTAMIAAVGIALSTNRYSQKHITSVAIWRCFGASRKQILVSHLKPLILMGLAATLIGIGTGYLTHQLLLHWIGSLVAQDIMPPSLLPVIWAFLVAFTLLIGFSGPSLLELTMISPVIALRQLEYKKSKWFFISIVASLITYAVLLIAISRNIYLSLTVLVSFVLGALVVVIFAWTISKWLGKLITGLTRAPLGLKFIGQRMFGGTQFTVVQITSLSIAMLALLLLTVIRTDVLSTWQSSISPDAPNRFLLNITPEQKLEVIKVLEESPVKKNWDVYPMVRGRLVKVNQIALSSESFVDENAKRLIDREFNLSYTKDLPVKNSVIAGKWLGANNDSHEISMEAGIMKSLGLKLGDQITFEVVGMPYEVKITSIRKLDWNSMRVNFFAIMPTSLLQEAPQTWIVAYHQLPNTQVDDRIVEQFPNVSAINVEQTIGQVNQMLGKLFYAVQALFIFALLAGLIVLFISVLGVQTKRLREAAILKTYGADQNYLNRVWFFEFITVGILAGLLSGNIAGVSAWVLVKNFLETEMNYPFWLIGMAVVLGVVCSFVSGLYLKYKISNVSTVKILQSF